MAEAKEKLASSDESQPTCLKDLTDITKLTLAPSWLGKDFPCSQPSKKSNEEATFTFSTDQKIWLPEPCYEGELEDFDWSYMEEAIDQYWRRKYFEATMHQYPWFQDEVETLGESEKIFPWVHDKVEVPLPDTDSDYDYDDYDYDLGDHFDDDYMDGYSPDEMDDLPLDDDDGGGEWQTV